MIMCKHCGKIQSEENTICEECKLVLWSDNIKRLSRGEIICPLCGKAQNEDKGELFMSYEGDDDYREIFCDFCNKKFLLKEVVIRKYEVKKLEGEE